MLTPTSFEPRHWSGFMCVMNWPACDAAAPELALLEELLVWASAGAAMKAVATRHAAICFFSMGSSWAGCTKSLRFARASGMKRRSPPEVHFFEVFCRSACGQAYRPSFHAEQPPCVPAAVLDYA